MGPPQGRVEGEENLPRPAGHAPPNAPQKSPGKHCTPGLAAASQTNEHKSLSTASQEKFHSAFCKSASLIPVSQPSAGASNRILLFGFIRQTAPTSFPKLHRVTQESVSIICLRSHHSAMMDFRIPVMVCNPTLTCKGRGGLSELKRLSKSHVSLSKFR